MFINSIHVRNYRCIADATLDCEPLTALVGPNGCGKSTFLKAIELFLSQHTSVAEEDFYNRDASADIEITVVFRGVDPWHHVDLSPYLDEDRLKTTRVFSWNQGRVTSKIFGYPQRHPGFALLRATSGATPQKEIYEDLRARPEYQDLPRWTKQADLPSFLEEWEANRPEECSSQRDDGDFFGVGMGASFDLSRLAQVVFIPAVRDAGADAKDLRGSPITELLDIAFRSGMFEREDFRQLQGDVATRYMAIVEKAKQEQFDEVERRLSRTMSTFVGNAGVKFDWKDPDQVKLPPPSADVLIVEDGFESHVERTGHGVQRAFTLSILQEMVAARIGLHSSAGHLSGDSGLPLPMLLLLIEEPELFQEPSRQRSIARTLQKLANGAIPGVTHRTQVIYGTHNPLFVSISRVEQVRVLRKTTLHDDTPMATSVRRLDPDSYLDEIAACRDDGDPVGEWAFHQLKLTSVMTPIVNEGLFAKGVVLVEGDIDRAGVIAASHLDNLYLEDLGVSVIQARGKANLLRLSLIFRNLGIDVYLVWDGDADKRDGTTEAHRRQKENRELYRLVGAPIVEPPTTQITGTFACIESNLESHVKRELGESYNRFISQAHERYGFKASDAIKHPVVFEEMLQAARAEGYSSPTLHRIVQQIAVMAERVNSNGYEPIYVPQFLSSSLVSL